MHPSRLAAHNLAPEDEPFVAAWFEFCRRHSLRPETGLRWYSTRWNKRMTPLQAAEDWRQFAGYLGWNAGDVESALVFHDAVALSGPEAFLPSSTATTEDHALIAYAENL